jgi:tRNA(Ile)-lysidine synthase
VLWDGRFWVEPEGAGAHDAPVGLGPLGPEGWESIKSGASKRLVDGTPKSAIWALPAIWNGDEVAAVPHLLLNSCGKSEFSAVFRPQRTLFSSTFAVA